MWTAVEIKVSKITVNVSEFVNVCKAKTEEVLGSSGPDEGISLLERYVNW
jgi:hypothetical protein